LTSLEVDKLKHTLHEITSQVILKIRSLFLPIIEKLIRDKQLAIYEPQLTILLGHIETLTSGLAQNLSIEASLSACELRIASLVKHGMTSEEIAAHLMISPATVRTHRRNIRQKLKISGSQDSLQTHLQSLEHRLTAPALSGNISADPAVGYRPQDRNGTHAAQHARITRYPVMHQMHPQPQPPVPTLAKSPQVFYNDTQHLTHASGTSQGAPNGIGKYLRSRGHHFKAQSDH